MVCPKCGANVMQGDNFCEECGSSMKKVISNYNYNFEGFPSSEKIICDSKLAAVTNRGRRHPTNEDAGMALKCENGDIILIVADGVSSSVNATSASQKAIEVIKETLINGHDPAKELIISAIGLANDCVKALPFVSREDVVYGPETTVVIALVQGATTTVGWVGDSRAYLLNKDKQLQLTVDDSWIEYVVAEGSMTREQASLDKRAHCVTQVLGMHDQEVETHVLECSLDEGDILLLCSDGLWNYLQGEKALLNPITSFGITSDTVHICEYLVGLANAAGGHDNITVAMFKNF